MATTAPSAHAPAGSPPAPVARDDRAGAGAGPSPGRALGRRRGLPGGRAVVGGLLVTLAAIGTFVAYTSASTGPSSTVVVADRALTPGQTLHAGDVRTIAAELPDAVIETLFASPAEVEGAVVLAAVDADQVLTRSALSTAGSDHARTRDLSFALERDRALNGRIQPGELVDLVATFGTGTDASTEVVARQVRVVAVDLPTGGGAGGAARITITVALDDEAEVLRAANALEVAHVTLTRSTGIDPAAPAADPVTAADHAGTTSADGDRAGGGEGP